jgi:uncharacterized protein involved in outer membrane biogenesis
VRQFFTFVAVLLVLALTAALVAPLFIDWSLHRGEIEDELSEIVGAPVVVAGPIDIRFLPTPYLVLKDVKIAATPGGPPALVCESIRLEAALVSLASGRVRFTLARLEHPAVTLVRRPDGGLEFPRWRLQVGGGRIALDRLVVEGGRLIVAGEASGPRNVDFNLDASAASLAGPFRGSGRFEAPGLVATDVDFASGPLDGGALPLKLEVSREGGSNAVFDGVLTLRARAADPAVDLAYAGSAVVNGAAALAGAGPPTPWRVTGMLSGDLNAASARDLVVRVGPEEHALEARGTARLEGGKSPRLSVNLAAKQLDLDALLRAKGEDAAPPARAYAGLVALLSQATKGENTPLAVDVALSAETAIVGAQAVSDIALRASASAGAPLSGELALKLPGDSSLRFTGDLELGSAAGFKGAVEAQLGDIAQLRDWATRGDADWARSFAALAEALPYRSAGASGQVEISTVGFSARDLNLVLDRSMLTGAIAFTSPVASERGRLFVDLKSDELDLDALPDLDAGAGLLADADLSLALTAAKLKLGRPGDEEIDSGSLALKLAKTGAELNLEKFSLSGLGGASVEASGVMGPKERSVKLSVDEEKLADLAALVTRVVPGEPSRWFAARADALSPTKATLEAWSADPSIPGLDSIKAQGSAGQTQFTFSAKRSGETADVNVTLDAADGSALMRQFGVATGGAAGKTHLEGSAKGRWDLGFDVRATGSLAGADVAWTGRVKPEASAEEAAVFGSATLKADNVSGLLNALGLAKSGGLDAPIDLKADMALRGGQLAIPRLTGSVAGAKLDGEATWRPAAPEAIDPDVALAQSIAGEAPASQAQLEGEFSLDHASLVGLLGPVLGAPQAKTLDAGFAPPLLDPPPLDLKLRISALDLGAGPPARSASARLRLDHGRLDIDDLAMTVGGANASGRATLRRDGATIALTGQGAIEPAPVDRPALRGRIGGEFSFAGSGPSLAGLIGSLAGDGRVALRGASVPHLDPNALTRVLGRPQGADTPIDETNVAYALGQEFDRGALPLPDGDVPATLSGGVVHVGPMAMAGATKASAAYDLRAQTLTMNIDLAAAASGKPFNGPQPTVAVALTGGLDAPTRRIDAMALAGGLAAQAIAGETERISALDADIRERAYFNRRLKAENFMRQRAAELAAYAADQARLKADEDRKRAADEAAKAAQAQPNSPPVADDAPLPPTSTPPTSPPIPARRPKPNADDLTSKGIY